jgi:hypothetical protein
MYKDWSDKIKREHLLSIINAVYGLSDNQKGMLDLYKNKSIGYFMTKIGCQDSSIGSSIIKERQRLSMVMNSLSEEMKSDLHYWVKSWVAVFNKKIGSELFGERTNQVKNYLLNKNEIFPRNAHLLLDVMTINEKDNSVYNKGMQEIKEKSVGTIYDMIDYQSEALLMSLAVFLKTMGTVGYYTIWEIRKVPKDNMYIVPSVDMSILNETIKEQDILGKDFKLLEKIIPVLLVTDNNEKTIELLKEKINEKLKDWNLDLKENLIRVGVLLNLLSVVDVREEIKNLQKLVLKKDYKESYLNKEDEQTIRETAFIYREIIEGKNVKLKVDNQMEIEPSILKKYIRISEKKDGKSVMSINFNPLMLINLKLLSFPEHEKVVVDVFNKMPELFTEYGVNSIAKYQRTLKISIENASVEKYEKLQIMICYIINEFLKKDIHYTEKLENIKKYKEDEFMKELVEVYQPEVIKPTRKIKF